jgi:hypothetical protein
MAAVKGTEWQKVARIKRERERERGRSKRQKAEGGKGKQANGKRDRAAWLGDRHYLVQE